MQKLLAVLLIALALVFALVASSWLVAPRFAAENFRMDLLDGAGRTTQIGDLWSFFAALSLFVSGGVLTRNSQWFYPPLVLLSLAVLGRTVAWLFHGAAFTADMVFVEVSTIGLLTLATRSRGFRRAG
jgi:hypothetical protein